MERTQTRVTESTVAFLSQEVEEAVGRRVRRIFDHYCVTGEAASKVGDGGEMSEYKVRKHTTANLHETRINHDSAVFYLAFCRC